MKKIIIISLVLLAGLNTMHAKETVVSVENKVIQEHCKKLGINFSGYSIPRTKQKAAYNFEGLRTRTIYWGPAFEKDGLVTYFKPTKAWIEYLPGQKFTVLNGPDKGKTGKIKEVLREYDWKGRKLSKLVVDCELSTDSGTDHNALMIEYHDPKMGNIPCAVGGYWMPKTASICNGDVPPGSYGENSLQIDASNEKQIWRVNSGASKNSDIAGPWQISFWIKAKEGSPSVSIKAPGCKGKMTITPDKTWKKHVLKVDAGNNPFHFQIDITGGIVLFDDVITEFCGDKNPTAFRDTAVNALKRFNPGIIRYLQMGGSTVEESINPKIKKSAALSSMWSKPKQRKAGKAEYSLHELYELSEYMNCEPWYCLPGTINKEEMLSFMEYLGAPENVGMGKLRKELGHPKPWTESLKEIHIEIGNEAWNSFGPFSNGGFYGPDYWHDLVAAAKKSPYYKKNVKFHIGGQNLNAGLNKKIIKWSPNADYLTIAPYMIHGMKKEEEKYFTEHEDDLLRHMLGYPLRDLRISQSKMAEQCKFAKEKGLELSVYEINHHHTSGDAGAEIRNKCVTSLAAGVSICNAMLKMMKDFGVKNQNFFCFSQNNFGIAKGRVNLWGGALSISKENQRFRPTWLACELANKVIGPKMLATKISGNDPEFSSLKYNSKKKDFDCDSGWKELHTYAFEDGKSRSLIIVNLGIKGTKKIKVNLGAPSVGPVKQWLLSGASPWSNNELEKSKPEVEIKESQIPKSVGTVEINLPAVSILALKWEKK